MTLFEKIMKVYPDLSKNDMDYIVIQNDSDGRGDYIAKWEHPTHPKPTDEELA